MTKHFANPVPNIKLHMKKITLFAFAVFCCISMAAQERQAIWPKNKMPDKQEHQIGAMTDESRKEDFNPDKNRMPYLEWYDAPAADKHI